MTRIAVIGDFDPTSATHIATNAALRHCADRLGLEIEQAWVGTDVLDDALFDHVSAVLIAPGSPYKDMAKTLGAIRFAREHGVPCLGTCGGFQHMVIEYACNVLGAQDAELFITQLACSLRGRSMNLRLLEDSLVAAHYGTTSASEQYYCDFGVDPARVAQLKSGPLRVTGSDAEGEVRVIELPGHPFFIGTLFLPQARSLPGKPHPLLSAFVRAAARQKPRERGDVAGSHPA
jgi:CTP synthase (UTP-ammonia lyase)